jgi:hypothetical protein
MEILRSRPDFAQAMAETDVPAADFERVWKRLQTHRRR